jgi:hypothetical protein
MRFLVWYLFVVYSEMTNKEKHIDDVYRQAISDFIAGDCEEIDLSDIEEPVDCLQIFLIVVFCLCMVFLWVI